MMVDTRGTCGVPELEDERLEARGGFALTNFLVCLIAAALTLLVALWHFNRKAY